MTRQSSFARRSADLLCPVCRVGVPSCTCREAVDVLEARQVSSMRRSLRVDVSASPSLVCVVQD
jgi:hypothetical protein